MDTSEAERDTGPTDESVANAAHLGFARGRTTATRAAPVEQHIAEIDPAIRDRFPNRMHLPPSPPPPPAAPKAHSDARSASLMASSGASFPVQNSKDLAPCWCRSALPSS